MNFFFPTEPAAADVAPLIPENPIANLLDPLLVDVLSLPANAMRSHPKEAAFDVSPEISSALQARHVENIGAVLTIAALIEAPKETPKEQPESGWIQAFLKFSGDAASKIEREVWGGLLAREVAEPKTVSRRTLHALHAMDQWELEAFTEYCAFAFSFESGWRFMFEGEAAHREIWSYGREIDLTQHWIDVGLLSGESSTLALRNTAGLRLNYRAKTWEVRLNQESASEERPPLCYRKFSPVGQQISSALSFKIFNGYARNLIQALEGQGHAVFNLLPDA